MVSCASIDATPVPSTRTSKFPRRICSPMRCWVSVTVAGILRFPSLGFVGCYKVKGSAPGTGGEPFPVEHRGHRPPSEGIDDQQRAGEPERESEGRHDDVERHERDDDEGGKTGRHAKLLGG